MTLLCFRPIYFRLFANNLSFFGLIRQYFNVFVVILLHIVSVVELYSLNIKLSY